MTDKDEIEAARRKGEAWGALTTKVENQSQRIKRLETILAGVVSAIIGGWAKMTGLW